MAFSSAGALGFSREPSQSLNKACVEEVNYGETIQRLSEAELGGINRDVSLLESDSAIVRRSTVDRLLSRASNGDIETCKAILSRLRGLRVSFSLDTRQLANQLIARVRLECHRRAVANLSPSPWGDSGENLDREVEQWWQLFSERAGEDNDSMRQFQVVAFLAGPDWHWDATLAAYHNRSVEEHWACLLGIRVPDRGIRYVPAAKNLQSKLMARYVGSTDNCTSGERVVGRLIESTVRRNPYGWPREACLGIALTHQRTNLVRELCEQIWNLPNARVRDLGLSLLAADRIEHEGLFTQIDDCLNDHRVIAVLPGRAHFGVGQADWPRSIVVPRISDVAQYLLWKHQDIDARQHGMTAIQADPVWGVRLESIGR